MIIFELIGKQEKSKNLIRDKIKKKFSFINKTYELPINRKDSIEKNKKTSIDIA